MDSRFKFALLTLTGRLVREEAADFAFFVHDPAELHTPGVRFALKPDEITLLNPNTGTSPIFRSRRDAEITLGIYRRIPILLKTGDPQGNPWGIKFTRMFDMSNDSGLFRTREQLEAEGFQLNGNIFERRNEQYVPLYEAKMVHQYDHRWASYAPDDTIDDVPNWSKLDPAFIVLPRYWVASAALAAKIGSRSNHEWFLGWRDIARSTDERTTIVDLIPRTAVGNKLPIVTRLRSACAAASILGALTSMVSDFVSRQKMGGATMNFFIMEQLAVPDPSAFLHPSPWDGQTRTDDWMANRVDELVFTAWDVQSFAQDLGDDGSPFRWDEDRRAVIRAELDAAFFHLYGLQRDEVEHVLDTFPIVRRKDVAKYGEYRTARLILEAYDAMAGAVSTGVPYQTVLDPPPGEGPRHPDREHVA